MNIFVKYGSFLGPLKEPLTYKCITDPERGSSTLENLSYVLTFFLTIYDQYNKPYYPFYFILRSIIKKGPQGRGDGGGALFFGKVVFTA